MPPDKQLLETALLVVRWQRGDRSAFEGIVKLWEQPLFYYLRRLAASEADAWELLRDTWLKILRSLGSLRDSHTFPAFLYKTARNNAISRLRRRGLEETANDTDSLHDESAAASTFGVLFMFVFLFVCGAWSLLNRIASAELSTREEMLRIECRLAEISERLQK